MRIRKYTPRDRQRVLDIFRLNIPDFFDIREVRDLEDYLERHADTYFVIEEGGQIVGAGGYHFPDASTGRLSWDFLDPAHRGRGLGRLLVEHCLEEMKKGRRPKTIVVETSQHGHRFYEKFGLTTEKVQKDYWGPGLDLFLMSMPVGE
jgi:ribosomal protein S18 acetylase RimI-like enzyme